MSAILGLDLIEKRLDSFADEMAVQAGKLIEEQALVTQRDLVNMLPQYSGRAVEALASPGAVKFKRDRKGNVIEASVGLNTLDQKRKAFHLLFLEKGRKAYSAGSRRFGGKDKAGRIKMRKVKRTVGAMAPRQYFRVAFTLLRERMKTARGINRLKAFALNNIKNG